jgi:hypothetical protein
VARSCRRVLCRPARRCATSSARCAAADQLRNHRRDRPIQLAIPGPAREPIPLTKLLTVEEYSALGETAWGYTELIQGSGADVAQPEHLPRKSADAADTRRIHHLDKRRDYADAGIPNYWIVDLRKSISLTACRLTEEFGYVDDQTATGVFRTEVPFPVEINLDRLV